MFERILNTLMNDLKKRPVNSLQRSAQKRKSSIKEFLNKCDHLQETTMWLHLLKKTLMENFIFCEVVIVC